VAARLPKALQEIKDAQLSLPLLELGPARHGIEFASESGHQLAEFSASGPLHLPSTGQEIKVHGVDVIVKSVSVAYETTEDGAPSVFATVVVAPLGDR
jgi:hypothetical protein